jgi:predicted nucleic acid-binding protein
MNGRFFLDTNVFVYTFHKEEVGKRKRASGLVEEALATQRGVISFQVVQEFLNVATRKFARPLSCADATTYLDRVLAPLCEVFSSLELYRGALEVAERWKYAFYDSLIVAAALESGCETLFSEDLQHGQRIKSLTIVNPFLAPT